MLSRLTGEAGMAFDISDECLACGVCMDECPEDAISEGEDIYVLNPDACNDCGACAEICPNDAISQVN
ncbi:MAG: DUF362 domain-containing protein [Thermoleophilia bacterium]